MAALRRPTQAALAVAAAAAEFAVMRAISSAATNSDSVGREV